MAAVTRLPGLACADAGMVVGRSCSALVRLADRDGGAMVSMWVAKGLHTTSSSEWLQIFDDVHSFRSIGGSTFSLRLVTSDHRGRG